MIPKILGVYESHKSEKVGTGATSQEHELRIYWFVALVPGGEIVCQPLNDLRLPSGFAQKIESADFMSNYLLNSKVFDEVLRPLTISLRDTFGDIAEPNQLPEFSREESMLVRGLMAFMHHRPDIPISETDIVSIRIMLDSMRQPDLFVYEYQKILTDAAIGLRKQRKFDDAVTYYKKALSSDTLNDHIMFNLARVYFEMGKIDEARILLLRAVEINPELEMARRFLRYLDASAKS